MTTEPVPFTEEDWGLSKFETPQYANTSVAYVLSYREPEVAEVHKQNTQVKVQYIA